MPVLNSMILTMRSFTATATVEEKDAYVARALELADAPDAALESIRSAAADRLKRLAARLAAEQPPATVRRANIPVWNSWIDVLPEQQAAIHQEVDLLERDYSAAKAILSARSAPTVGNMDYGVQVGDTACHIKDFSLTGIVVEIDAEYDQGGVTTCRVAWGATSLAEANALPRADQDIQWTNKLVRVAPDQKR